MRTILKPSSLQMGGNLANSNAATIKPSVLRPPVFKLDNSDADGTQPTIATTAGADQSTPSPNPFLLNSSATDDDSPNDASDVAGDSGIGESIEPQDAKPTENQPAEVCFVVVVVTTLIFLLNALKWCNVSDDRSQEMPTLCR